MTKVGYSRVAGRAALTVVVTLMVAMVWAMAASGTAQAQVEPYSSNTPTVLPTIIHNPPEGEIDGTRERDLTGPDRVEGNRPAAGLLPFTGSELVLFVIVGGAAVALGTLLIRRARRTDS